VKERYKCMKVSVSLGVYSCSQSRCAMAVRGAARCRRFLFVFNAATVPGGGQVLLAPKSNKVREVWTIWYRAGLRG